MTEQLISFETFNLAREKGLIYNVLTEYTKRPTQSFLQKWLREKYNIDIWCIPIYKGKKTFHYQLAVESDNILNQTMERYKTYEEALEFGLQEALKLI